MSRRFEFYRRLESSEPFGDLEKGFRAEIHDPAWFLGQQWIMGEHEGEDASSPVEIRYVAENIPLDPHMGDQRMDPRIVPPEAIIESEPGDWWTPGRRIRLGKAYADVEGLPADNDALQLMDLPFPYDKFNGKGYDGYKLYQQDKTHPVFVEVPSEEPDDLWDSAELAYSTTFQIGQRNLRLERHDGGQVEWYSVDADGELPLGTDKTETRVLPTRMRYPGAPHPRWWQIEDSKVDIGGYGPDRGHFATMLLIDLIVSHSDDWFTFPLETTVGTVVKFHEVIVLDSFDDEWTISPVKDWTLFAVTGLDPSSLLVWPSVTNSLSGIILEDVVLGIDEDANLLWAVEQRVDGLDLPTEVQETSTTTDTSGTVLGSKRTHYRFRASEGVRPYWHPYTLQQINGRRRFVQGRAADLSVTPPRLMPDPRATLLYDFANLADDPVDQVEPVHQIEPATIPSQGIRIKRRWMLVRQTNGQPRLWIQRQRTPLLSPPVSGLHFDVFERLLDVGE